MTLPSRRKRPTTPPNTRPESPTSSTRRYVAGDGTGGFVRSESIWLPAALLATLALLVTALQALGDQPQLQWRRAQIPRTASSGNSSGAIRDYAVRQAAHTQGTWQPTGPSLAPPAPMAEPHFRTAQATPFIDDPATGDLGRDLNEPFGLGSGADELPPPDSMFDDTPPDSITPIDPLDNGSGLDDMPLEPLPFDDNTSQPRQPVFEQPSTDRNPATAVEADPDTGDALLDPFDRPRTGDGLGTAQPTPADTADAAQAAARRGESLEAARQRSEKACADELAKIKSKRLDDIDLSIRIAGTPGEDFPFECSIDDGTPFSPRAWYEVTYMWKAAANCHKPLFFEDVHLERYGHSWGPGLQPIVSGAHFFSRLPVLPYQMGLTPPNECIYPLGHYRPGNCAPYMIDPIPFTWRAAIFEAGAWVGGAAIIP